MNNVIRANWEHIPGSLRKVFVIVINTPEGRQAVAQKRERDAWDMAERMFGV